jgi:SAM-dependent methyltransferase
MEATTTVLAETKQAFHQPEWYFQKRGYHVQVRIETISEFLKGSQFGRMLDIGCGMLARAKSRIPTGLSSNVDIFKSDFMGANLEPNSYDLIICLGVLAYIETPDLFLAKLASLLKPGGHLILEWTDGHHFVPRVFSIYERVLRLFRPPKVHLVCQNGGQLLATLNGLGFRTTGSFRYCSPLPVVRRLLGERLNYRLIRAVHGDAVHNRAAWLGDECIHHFRKTA